MVNFSYLFCLVYIIFLRIIDINFILHSIFLIYDTFSLLRISSLYDLLKNRVCLLRSLLRSMSMRLWWIKWMIHRVFRILVFLLLVSFKLMFKLISRTSILRVAITSKWILFRGKVGFILINKCYFFILKLNNNWFIYNDILINWSTWLI